MRSPTGAGYPDRKPARLARPRQKTQIHQNKHNATIKPLNSNTNITHNMKIQLYKQRAVPNDTERKSPGTKMATPAQSATPKITINPNTAAPTQLSNKIHLYSSCTQARAQAGTATGESHTGTCKSSKATTLANTYMSRHSAQSCETCSYNYSDRRNSAALW